jgi:hypothetical protein
MQAQAQAISPSRPAARGRNTVLAWILGIYVAMHVMWLVLPSFVDGDEVGPVQYAVNSTSLTLGLIAIFGMWKGFRWGRWMMIVITILMFLLTGPEVIFLTGIMRAASIAAFTGIVAIAVLLFRPEARNQG